MNRAIRRTRKQPTGARRGQQRPPPNNLNEGSIIGNIAGTLAIWRKKDGIDVFTGIVRIPATSPGWAWLDYPFCMAELLHPWCSKTDYQSFGPSRVISPAQFLERMRIYD